MTVMYSSQLNKYGRGLLKSTAIRSNITWVKAFPLCEKTCFASNWRRGAGPCLKRGATDYSPGCVILLEGIPRLKEAKRITVAPC